MMVDRCRKPPSAACEPACDPWQRDRWPIDAVPVWVAPPAVSDALCADEQSIENGVVDVPSEEARRGERPAAEVAEMDL